MSIINIAVTRPFSALVLKPGVVAASAGDTVVWTLDASVVGSFDSGQPFAWYPHSAPPDGACSSITLAPDGRRGTMHFHADVTLEQAYQLFVKLDNGTLATTALRPIVDLPGFDDLRVPAERPRPQPG
ncbi:hypothetical protein [Nevskia sp.]|uniref:hypothetical protein n=1 Tax=Nevskia sp. TaxID=1929292 RepID=UPI0025D32C91|nr:hypothetical protein [Nevskia sp.]